MDHSNEWLLRMECTLFFQSNPFTYETVEGLARRLGRTAEALYTALDYLTERSILHKIGEGAEAVYHYVQPDMNQRM